MLPLVTLCGSYNLTKSWVEPCIASWSNLSNVSVSNYHLIPDGRLDEQDAHRFQTMGFQVHAGAGHEQRIAEALQNYPSLALIRNKDLTWRKLLDTVILFKQHDQVLLIDTDVYVSNRTKVPLLNADFIYMLEDIPAYRGHWMVAWKEPMVPAFNAGMVIFRPSAVDFAFLEYLTKNYVLSCKDYWWSEQLAWACLAGRTPLRYVFDGKQTRVVSGFLKRTPEEVVTNRFSYFGKRGTINDFDTFRPYISGATVLHFAGLGKRWFDQSKSFLDSNASQDESAELVIYKDKLLSAKDKCLISSRLMLKELK